MIQKRMMTGSLPYIRRSLWILLLACAGCTDKSDPAGVVQSDKELVEIFISDLSTCADTHTGSDSERNIKEIDLLIFKGDEFQYYREAYRSENSYMSTLKIEQGLTLYFIVNSRSVLQSSDQLVEGKSWENDIRPSLILKDSEGLLASDSLPMWGIRENVNIVAGQINQFFDIFLLRAVASVDVFNSEDPATFSLQEAYIYFAPDKGYLAPSPANYSISEKGVSGPESPADMQNLASSLKVDNVEDEKLLYQLYLYENDAPTNTVGQKRYSRFVIGGSFEGGATTYYPVDLLEDDNTTILQATRNYKYVINIASVSSEGYPDPGTAAQADDSRLEVEIIDWNLKDENELGFDGPFFISIESKHIYLYDLAGSTRSVSFTTNIATDDLTMEFIDSGNGTQVDGSYSIANDRFKVEFVFDEQNKIKALLITALGDFDPNDQSRNLQDLKIYSKRVVMQITLEQIHEDPTQWIDGGEKDIDLGGE